jgi:hypothetical protein
VALAFNRYVKTWGTTEDVFYSEFSRGAQIELKLHYCLVFFFVLIAIEFLPLGQKIGKDLKAFTPPLRGYVINILGSLLGVVAFAGVSFLQLSPVWWFGTALALLLWFVRRERWLLAINGAAAVVALVGVWQAGAGFIWSPYHKLVTSQLILHKPTGLLWPFKEGMDQQQVKPLPFATGFHIAVDEDFLQMALDLSPGSVAAQPFLNHYRQQYDLPYGIPNFPYRDVLIVGSGSGNDTAAALRHNVRHVDAVEIDPCIVQLGRTRHPNRPYENPRVNVVVGDARSYFNKTTKKYDLVVFGLLDSHRLFSSMSSVRSTRLCSRWKASGKSARC